MNENRVVEREHLDGLAEQIATFSLRIDVATQAMLTYLREFDSHTPGMVRDSYLLQPGWLGGEVDPSVLEAERADALVNVAQAYLQHDQPRTLGSGYELVMLTSPEQLEHAPGGVGGFLRDGTPVPHHIARMLACDCSRVDVTTNGAGEILDVGRARRTIPSAIARALQLRDGGCRVPGCGRKYHLHAHHIEACAEGGKTSQSNLALLCPSHHALVHEGQLFVDVRDDKLEFKNAYGLPIPTVPPRPGDPESIGRWLYEDPHITRFPQWDGSPLDIEYVINSALA